MKATSVKSLGIAALAAMLFFSGHAVAQSEMAKKPVAQSEMGKKVEARLTAAVQKIQDACGEDVKKFCGSVTPGEGRVLMCMMAYEDQVSNKCDYALYQASRNLERAVDRLEMTADACGDDIEKHCAMAPGGGRIAQCLVAKKASLSKKCSGILARFSSK
jgi:hypothetical protein